MEQIAPYLARGSFLDIGCGFGGPAVLMQQICEGRAYLLDGDGWGERQALFGQEMEPFNYLSMTRLMMETNDITDYEIWDVAKENLPRVDNVVSLLSWGWHYPVGVYRGRLQCKGPIILDIRSGTDGQAQMAEHYELVNEWNIPKGKRTIWSSL